MIRSDLDESGYEGPAADFRSYLSRRLERNGTTVSVTEPQDFAAIIRRRIFNRPERPLPIPELARAWEEAATKAWREQVFDRLPGARQLSGFAARLERSYPFHPDVLGPLVSGEAPSVSDEHASVISSADISLTSAPDEG